MATLDDIRNDIKTSPNYLTHREIIDTVGENIILVTFEIYKKANGKFIREFEQVLVLNYHKEGETAMRCANENIGLTLEIGTKGKLIGGKRPCAIKRGG